MNGRRGTDGQRGIFEDTHPQQMSLFEGTPVIERDCEFRKSDVSGLCPLFCRGRHCRAGGRGSEQLDEYLDDPAAIDPLGEISRGGSWSGAIAMQVAHGRPE